ncbi:MAG: VOC family protein [candidate division Zixibacteria bacterium]
MKFSRMVIRVADYRKSFEFYHDILGLKLSSSWQRRDSWGALFSAGNATVEIIWYPSGEGLQDCDFVMERKKISIDFEVNDIDILFKRLADTGVEIIKEPHDVPWGFRVFSISDPDGIAVSFSQPIG